MFQSSMDRQRASARPRIVVLGGIGFTMSLFIAGQAFPGAADFMAAKIAILAASLLTGVIGTAVPWRRVPARTRERRRGVTPHPTGGLA